MLTACVRLSCTSTWALITGHTGNIISPLHRTAVACGGEGLGSQGLYSTTHCADDSARTL